MIGWTSIFSKGLAPVLLISAGVIGGVGLQQRVFSAKPLPCPQCPPAPACICPPQTSVSVQPFDVQKMKNIRAFTYQPEYKGVISVAGIDSTAIKRYISDAVVKAFAEHVTSVETAEVPKRKRR